MPVDSPRFDDLTLEEEQALIIFTEGFAKHNWDAFTFDDDTLTVTARIAIDSLPDDHREALMAFDGVTPNSEGAFEATFSPEMVSREASPEEFEALKDGYRGVDTDHESEAEAVFYERGANERERFDTDDPEEALNGRVPNPLVYYEQSSDGPKPFGFSLDFTTIDAFDPDDTERLIEEGSWAELYPGDYPEIDAFHPDSELRYEIHFGMDSATVKQVAPRA